jgi:TRAP transporter TAXI family solute receptor
MLKVLITTAIALFTAFSTLETGAQARELKMGAASTSSSLHAYYTAVGKSISTTYPDSPVTLDTVGLAFNAEAMRDGKMDFGAVSPDIVSDMAEQGFTGFRTLWHITPLSQNTMVTKASGITKPEQLQGKCLNPGPTGSSTAKNMQAILKLFNVEPKYLLATADGSIDAIKAGTCIAQTRSLAGDKLDAPTAALDLVVPLTPIGWDEVQREKIKAAIPSLYLVQIPAGIVDGAPSYWTHAYWTVIYTTNKLDEESAYRIMKGMWQKYNLQQLALPVIRDKDVLKVTLEHATTPLHAGAVRFYREIGLIVPDRLIPPESR